MNIKVQQLWFNAPRQVEIRDTTISTLAANEVLVEVLCSAISAGTEMLVYRGQLPPDIALDATISSLQQQRYPLRYGYACVGRVVQVGSDVMVNNDAGKSLLGKNVFAFQPHASHFVSPADELIPVPDDISAEDAVFLANMETAVNLMQDGKPILGESVVVLGQGIVGLLLTSLLVSMPLTEILVADQWSARRDAAKKLGAKTFNPFDANEKKDHVDRLKKEQGADLIYELTGVPDALNLAIECSGYHSRVVVGSWYGSKSSPIHLGGAAHRNRLQIMTSQVSSIAPELSARWTKARRFDVTWGMIRRVGPARFISDRAPLSQAPHVYERLDQHPELSLQTLFIHSVS